MTTSNSSIHLQRSPSIIGVFQRKGSKIDTLDLDNKNKNEDKDNKNKKDESDNVNDNENDKLNNNILNSKIFSI